MQTEILERVAEDEHVRLLGQASTGMALVEPCGKKGDLQKATVDAGEPDLADVGMPLCLQLEHSVLAIGYLVPALEG